jgi:carboxyl-terminal processing protease
MKTNDRYTWIGVSLFIVVFALAATFAPTLLAQQMDSNTQNYINRIEYAFNFILKNYVDEIPPEELYEGAMKGLFESLDDPYSYYLTKSDMEDISDTTTGKFGGVGLYISKPAEPEETDDPDAPKNRFVNVVAPIEDTPAYRAGIHAGDLITKIEGESTEDLTIDEVVDRLRGEPGTTVQVTIRRGKNITFKVDLKRAIVEIPTIKHAMIEDSSIGYIRIIQFTPYTDKRLEEALSELESKGYESLIVDVRGNPGGLLQSVTDVMDFFLDEGLIVSTRSRIPQENEEYRADSSVQVPKDIPIAVLIDEGSASASEILAGAFDDSGRGALIGETTFGKGSVQRIIPFGQGGFKLTISRYFTPDGVNIDKVGIEPNVTVKDPELSETENAALKRIFEENLIKNFVDKNPEASEEERQAFIDRLQRDENLDLTDRQLGRLLRNEYHRRMDFPPVYDLEYDRQLQKAVELIKTGSITNYMVDEKPDKSAARTEEDLQTSTERKAKP